ncbi:MAG TPA: DUF481 domain-containing protein [Kiritimatiellia bacterium]|nr:DUF481 domain-containing protein [Kiritimatiellia bacterium]
MRRAVVVLLAVLLAGAMLPAARAVSKKKLGVWERELSLGLNIARGNTEQDEGEVGLRIKRQDEISKFDVSAEAAYGETDSDTTKERAKAAVQYDQQFGPRPYGSMRVSMEYDAVADLDYRLIVGPALGYYLVKKEETQLSAELGPSYVRESVEGELDDFYVLRLAERFEQKWGKDAKLWQTLEYLPDLQANGKYLLNAELGLEAKVTGGISLRAVVATKHDSRPADDKKRDDTVLKTAIVYKF